MSELEDRILKIVELRASGLNDSKIARKLGLDATVIKMYENSAEKVIKEAISKGYKTLDNIGRFTQLSPVVVDMYTKIYGIEIPLEDKINVNSSTEKEIRIRKSQLDSIKAIQESIEKGAKSIEDIMGDTGLAKNTVRHYACNEGIKLPRSNFGEAISEGRTKSRNKKLQIIRDSLNEKVNSLEELCKRIGMTAGGVKRYCARFGIELPEDIIAYKQRPEIDALIAEGRTLLEIGDEVGLSRERVRQYIVESGQYKQYRNKREEVKNSPKIEENKFKELQGLFLSAVRTRTEELAKEEGFATEKAVEYLHSYRYNFDKEHKYPFDLLYTVFQRYENAFKRGKRLSLEELGEGLGLYDAGVGRILARVGLEPMYGNLIRTIKVREKNDAVQRGVATEFTNTDLAYFLGLPEHTPRNRFSYKKIKRKKNKPLAGFGNREYLSHRSASEIYEAEDCGFKKREIITLVNKSKRLVDYALEHRKEIEPKIIKGLKILYGNTQINTPYVTVKMREKLEKEEIKRRKG